MPRNPAARPNVRPYLKGWALPKIERRFYAGPKLKPRWDLQGHLQRFCGFHRGFSLGVGPMVGWRVHHGKGPIWGGYRTCFVPGKTSDQHSSEILHRPHCRGDSRLVCGQHRPALLRKAGSLPPIRREHENFWASGRRSLHYQRNLHGLFLWHCR